MGCAAQFLEQGSRPAHQSHSMVVGELAGDDIGDFRVCYEADGSPHQLGMLQCTLDGQPRDWLLSTERISLHTDAIIDWTATHRLRAARADWGAGEYFPSLEAMRHVLLCLGSTVMPTLNTAPANLKQMCLEIAVFTTEPESARLPIVTGHAHSVKNSFLEGGLIRDSLMLFASLETKHIRDLSRLASADSQCGELAPAEDGTHGL